MPTLRSWPRQPEEKLSAFTLLIASFWHRATWGVGEEAVTGRKRTCVDWSRWCFEVGVASAGGARDR
jgi:hypothetical protein